MPIKYVAVGECPNCGIEIVRPAICTHAACDCSSVVEVPLHPVLVLPSRLHAKIKHVTDLAGISVEDFVNSVLNNGMKRKLKEMNITYEL